VKSLVIGYYKPVIIINEGKYAFIHYLFIKE